MAAQASPFNPLARLDPGEDVFPIREKDPVGPAVIVAWCHLRRNRAVKLYGTAPTGDAKRLFDAEMAQCAEAEEKAATWAERQAGHEAADESRASYAGAALTEEQVALAKRQKNLAALLSHLREAAYHATEILDADGPAASAELLEQRDRINEIAGLVGVGERRAAA
jgi:hypothetical protein